MKEVKDFIAKGETDEAINLLIIELKKNGDNESINQVLLISSRFSELSKRQKLGLEYRKEEINEINYSLLQILDEYEKIKDDKKLNKSYNNFYASRNIRNKEINYPTINKPMLIGFLIDVSLSMTSSIKNSSGKTQSRLESFQDSFDDLLEQAKKACYDEKGQKIVPLFKLFLYGFGFGNIFARFFSSNRSKVRSLLKPDKSSDIVTIDKLIDNWKEYENYIKDSVSEMFGETPMYEAITMAKQKISNELKYSQYTHPIVLFIISDGEPTDAEPNEIIKLSNELKEQGVLIISTFINDSNIVEYKKLYSEEEESWSAGAKLMFNSSSELPIESPFYAYLREFNWNFNKGAKLFAQVNEAETLKEFLNIVLSPLSKGK